MDTTFDPGSNVSVARDRQPLKQLLQILSREGGISIDESDEQFWNAQLSMHEILAGASNVAVQRDVQ
jgi:hypothetical protein